jgi:hypothetical protein
MRIDYIIDSYSQNYPVEPKNQEKTKQSGVKTAEKIQESFTTQQTNESAKVEKPALEKKNDIVSDDANKVLNADEKQMLIQLFPPGLFGAGIRAYKYYSSSSEQVNTLGNKIDVRQ